MIGTAVIAGLRLPTWLALGAESVSRWQTSTPGLLVGAVLLVAVGLLVILRRGPRQPWIGVALALSGFLLLVSRLESLDSFGWSAGFWCLAALTVSAAVATITSYNPVYSAIWFAVSLLGTGSLFLLQGAQFLGVATVVVYAGAIVVTFLFVLMLAQPSGHAYYDRIQWGLVWTFLAVLTGAALLGGITLAVAALTGEASWGHVSATVPGGSQHVAELGGQLFARHLVAVEVAGTLLLVALVGAVAIVIQGKASAGSEGGPSHE